MNQEAIEYRIKRNRQQADVNNGFLIGFVGWLGMAIGTGMMSPTVLMVGTVTLFAGAVGVSMGMSVASNGYNRAFWSHFMDYSDPPLDDWESRLEDEGAFTTVGYAGGATLGGEQA